MAAVLSPATMPKPRGSVPAQATRDEVHRKRARIAWDRRVEQTVREVVDDFVRRLIHRVQVSGVRTVYAVFVTPEGIEMADVDSTYRYQRYVDKWGQYEIGRYNVRINPVELRMDIYYALRQLGVL